LLGVTSGIAPGAAGWPPCWAIAARLLLSRRTVATHVSHVVKKLDVHSRTDIARESALHYRVEMIAPRQSQAPSVAR
jgi:hypothetical protein